MNNEEALPAKPAVITNNSVSTLEEKVAANFRMQMAPSVSWPLSSKDDN